MDRRYRPMLGASLFGALSLLATATEGARTLAAPRTPLIAVVTTTDSESDVAAGDVVGVTWTPATGNLAGLDSECGNLSNVTVRPDRDELIVGVALGGLWSSVDGGATWDRLGSGAGSADATLRLSRVLFDVTDPNRFWISGTYNGPTMLETSDGGTTFVALSPVPQGEHIGVDMTDPQRQTLIVGIHESGRVFGSRDGGQSWEELPIDASFPNADIGISSSVMVLDSQTYLYGTHPFGGDQSLAGPGIFRTADGGVTWVRVLDHGVSGEPTQTSDGTWHWLLAGGDGIASSADDGATWTITPSTAISPFAQSLVIMPDERFATISDNHVILSADRGASWRIVDTPLPYDPNGLTYSPFRGEFYVSKFDCNVGSNPIRPDQIMKLEFRPAGG